MIHSTANTIDTSCKTTTGRLLYFDLIKGFAIICVIIGHNCSVGSSLRNLIYFFHMPLFFIVNGYFLNTTKPLTIRIRRLIKPYIFCSCGFIIISILSIITSNFLYDEVISFKEIIKLFISVIWGCAWFYNDMHINIVIPYIGAIWFFLTLSWATAAVWFVAKLKFKPVIGVGIVFCLSYLAKVSYTYICLPLSVQPGLYASLFVYIGYLMHKYAFWQKWHYTPIAIVVCVLIYFFRKEVFSGFEIGVCLGTSLQCLNAIAISIIIISAFRYIASANIKLGMLAQFGVGSLVVLCTHFFKARFISPIIREYLNFSFNN